MLIDHDHADVPYNGESLNADAYQYQYCMEHKLSINESCVKHH